MAIDEPLNVAAARRELGALLARLRRVASLPQRELASRINYCRSSVANVETGIQRVPRAFWQRCDEVLSTGGVLLTGHDRIGLLQLGASTSADSMAGGDANAPIDDPAQLAVHWTQMLGVLAQSHNLVGGRQIHEVALRELDVISRYTAEAAGRPRTSLLAAQARWAEFASWTAEHVGDRAASGRWLRQALEWAGRAGDARLTAYALMRQAQQAADRLDGTAAAGLADKAAAAAYLTDRDRALCSIRAAHGHALRGDRSACRVSLKAAYRLVSRADATATDDDPSTIGVHCVRSYAQVHEAYCLLVLGETAAAITMLEDALAAWPSGLRQDQELARAWLALAYASGGRLADAGLHGEQVLHDSFVPARSARTLRALHQLDTRLASRHGPAEVTRFRAAYASAAAAFTMPT